MSRPNPASGVPSGVLLVDKAPDMTSHDVVAIARRSLGTKKIGHCGTLDPMAAGMLILTIARGTTMQDLLMSEEKEYVGTVTLGAVTSTQDKEGEFLEEKEVPDLSEEEIVSAFENLTGDFEQIPPMVSAIKKDGVPLYKLARQGKEIVREPRPVTVFEYEITRITLPVCVRRQHGVLPLLGNRPTKRSTASGSHARLQIFRMHCSAIRRR